MSLPACWGAASVWTMTVQSCAAQLSSAVDAVGGRAASSTRSWTTSHTLPEEDADGARPDMAVAGRDDDGRNASSTMLCSTSSTARLVAVAGRGVGTVNIMASRYIAGLLQRFHKIGHDTLAIACDDALWMKLHALCTSK